MDDKEPTINVPAFVDRVVYSNPVNDFAILACSLNDQSSNFAPDLYPSSWIDKGAVTVKTSHFSTLGTSFAFKPIVFCGHIVEDKKYGPQINASYHFADMPSDKRGMIAYLDCLPNIGEDRAKKMVDVFGPVGIVDVIENHPEKLIDMKIGLTKERVDVIIEKWMEDRIIRKVYLWFGDRGLGRNIIAKIVQKWKADAITVIENDPYALMAIRGIGFKKADEIAYKIHGDSLPVPDRVSACLSYILNEAINHDGHVSLPIKTLEDKAVDLLSSGKFAKLTEPEYRGHIQAVVISDESKFCMVENGGIVLVYSPSMWVQEARIADMIVSLAKSKRIIKIPKNSIEAVHQDLKQFYNKEIILDETQLAAVFSPFQNRITVITGGAGTGKSSICRCICSIAESSGCSVKLLSPTGKAAKVLAEKTGAMAETIHRGLGLSPGSVTPSRFIHDDLLVVDETSMCGIDTTHALMDSIKTNPNINLVFVGDPQQLPSVSPGNILHDIISSNCANVVKLNRIYRQDKDSFISVVADQVARGEKPVVPQFAKDITMKECDPDAVVGFVTSMVEAYLNKGLDINDLQIIAPMYRGVSGVDAINKSVQEMVAKHNSITKFFDRDFVRYYLGDRVMQQENDYKKEVYNGDIGTVSDIGIGYVDSSATDESEPFIEVDFGDGKFVRYSSSQFSQIKPAWCITVHKFQGSQCANIVFIATSDHYIMMNRELVYTGITRAKKKVVIVGSKAMLNVAAEKSVSKKRFTSLANMIRQDLTGEKLLRYYHCPMKKDEFGIQVMNGKYAVVPNMKKEVL